MQLTVNGTARDTADGVSLVELVSQISDRVTGIAVAVNSEVVPRGEWPMTALAEGDRVDVVTAVQGG